MAALLAALSFIALTGLYEYVLRDVGEGPNAPSGSALPRLVQLAVWSEAGERPAKFDVEPAWPWTPVLDLLLMREVHEHSRAGWLAADRVAGLVLIRRGLGGIRYWHLRRMALTVWLSRHWSASELTQELADELYFGRNARGIRDAAQAFYGKPVEELSAGDLALLVGLLQSPSRLGPDCHPAAATKRRNLLLRFWGTSGLISAEVAASEATKPLGVTVVQARCAEAGE